MKDPYAGALVSTRGYFYLQRVLLKQQSHFSRFRGENLVCVRRALGFDLKWKPHFYVQSNQFPKPKIYNEMHAIQENKKPVMLSIRS